MIKNLDLFNVIGQWGFGTFGPMYDLRTGVNRVLEEIDELKDAMKKLDDVPGDLNTRELFEGTSERMAYYAALDELCDNAIASIVTLYSHGKVRSVWRKQIINMHRDWLVFGDGTGKHWKDRGYTSWPWEVQMDILDFYLSQPKSATIETLLTRAQQWARNAEMREYEQAMMLEKIRAVYELLTEEELK